MKLSHFTRHLESLVDRGLDGIEDKIKSLQPMRTMMLYERSYDRLFNKFERLPPQAFYNDVVAEEIFTALEEGMDEVSACAIAMVPASIVKKWIILGKKGAEPFQTFWLRFERAIALGERASIQQLKTADPIAWPTFHLNKGRPSRHYKDVQIKKLVIEAPKTTARVLSAEEKAAKIKALLGGGGSVVEGKVVD